MEFKKYTSEEIQERIKTRDKRLEEEKELIRIINNILIKDIENFSKLQAIKVLLRDLQVQLLEK